MIIKLRVIEIVDTLKLQRSILDALFNKISAYKVNATRSFNR